jgi:hypothetical protein
LTGVKNHIKAVSRVALVAVVVVVIVAAAVGGLFLTGVLTTQEQKRQIIIGLSLPLTNPSASMPSMRLRWL